MKKISLTTLAAFAMISVSNAQETLPTLEKGKFLLETNFSPFSSVGSNGFYLKKSENAQQWGVGGEAGYFVADKLAIKAGVGYTKTKQEIELMESSFNMDTQSVGYKIGAKYYIANHLPFQVDFGGIKVKNLEHNFILGGQLGYAWIINNIIIIEPRIRYDITETKDGYKQYENMFSAQIGFSIHF